MAEAQRFQRDLDRYNSELQIKQEIDRVRQSYAQKNVNIVFILMALNLIYTVCGHKVKVGNIVKK